MHARSPVPGILEPDTIGPADPRAGTTQVDRQARRATGLALPQGLQVIGAAPSPRPGDIIALIVAREEALRLPDALAAARALGVHRAIVIDNGSDDGTREIAAAAGAHVILAEEDYAASNFGVTWTNAVLDACARGHWVLVIDADEQLVFPGSDRVGLPALTAHLDALGSEALRTVMLDCFPAGPLAECGYRGGMKLSEVAAMFEPPRLRSEAIGDFPYRLEYGGIRERLFFPETDPARPTRWIWQRLFNLGLRMPRLRHSDGYRRLAPPRSPTVTKVPLLRWREGAALLGSTHRVAPMAMAEEQPTGVLLHFKFLQDFHARALDAVRRDAHFDGSREYRRYLARIRAEPGFSLAGPESRRYEGPEQLARLGLMRDTPAWRAARREG
ncbi:glycosyltransferase family 2 protein [Falsiroseomonas oryziterrae]|uniref:glycosyltransferase family 2 protein n=1 Tax=Falsiroseomonas oryziterrae TaxID=2911368 RepID=UPI001F34CF9C|nr:glycosyltransferase family 2 protein [Roseomonas sp. NPKOSM-4]